MEKNPKWKNKVQGMFQVCQDELKRTTKIGKKMISASKTSSDLQESYKELGQLVFKSMKNGTLDWNNQTALEINEKIELYQSDLDEIEKEVNKIKFSPAPVDISKEQEVKQEVKKEEPLKKD